MPNDSRLRGTAKAAGDGTTPITRLSGASTFTRPTFTRHIGGFGLRKRGSLTALRLLPKWLRYSTFLTGLASAAMGFAGWISTASVAHADSYGTLPALPTGIFLGALTFALFAAFWMMRERIRKVEELSTLKSRYGSLRADRDRLSALAESGDQRIVIWEGNAATPQVAGHSGVAEGMPEAPENLIAFGRWLSPDSAQHLETAVGDLRSDARQFTMPLRTKADVMIEAQGRVSGNYAFVRFVPLNGIRSELARLRMECDVLANRFSVIDTLFEQMPVPFWINDAEGRLSYANPAYAAAVDAKDVDVAVRDNLALFDAKERDLIGAALSKAGFHHDQLPAVVAGDRKLMQAIIARSEGGTAGIAIDRSEIEAIKATLKHTIASHQHTFDHLTTAVAIFDRSQRLQFHNSSFQQLWDFQSADLEGNPSNGDLLEILRTNARLPETPDWRKWKQQLLSTYHSTEATEDTWQLPDGTVLRVIINPQSAGGTSWVFENVTEELALKSNYNSLMRMQGETLDHLNEAVAVFGPDGKVRLTNPAFLSLWGLSDPDEIEGNHVRDVAQIIGGKLHDKEIWERIHLDVTSVREDREDQRGRVELTDGKILDYHLVSLPAGQAMLTLSDVTAAAREERALQERNEALLETDELKNRFLQHVSYELRAPLTTISGFSEMLATEIQGALNDKQREYIDHIGESSEVLKGLIDDILDLATIDAGAMVLDLQPVNMREIVDQCLALQSDQIERFNLKFDLSIDPSVAGLIADPKRIRQIIQNLLANAIKASPDGGAIRITATRSSSKSDERITLEVADQGPGMTEQEAAIAFDRFVTMRGGERKRGAGLGLALVQSLIELHGGTVEIDRTVEKGTCIVCRFPYAPVETRQAAE